MISVAELVLAVAWTFGANGFLIERHLAGASTLPVAWVEPVSHRVDVAFHDRADWAMAFYVSGNASGAPPRHASETPSGSSAARTAVPPRLVLYAPYYLAPEGLTPPPHMAVDIAEYYFHALLEAALDLELHAAESPYAVWMEARAAERMTAVPEAQRLPIYVSALAEFGAHLLSIRNELTRVAERQAVAGRDLCRQLDREASLFGLWHRGFASGRYAGRAFVSNGAGPPRMTPGRQPLERVDKDRFVREILGVDWVGEPRRDFATLCARSSHATEPIDAM